MLGTDEHVLVNAQIKMGDAAVAPAGGPVFSTTKYAKYYNSEEMSDVKLVIRTQLKAKDAASLGHAATTTPSPKPKQGFKFFRKKKGVLSCGGNQLIEDVMGSGWVKVSEYPAHAIVLASHSKYFATQLKRKEKSGEPVIVDMEVDVEDVLIARQMVNFMYTEELPDDMSYQSLICLVALADRYEADQCLATAMNRLLDMMERCKDMMVAVEVLHLGTRIRKTKKISGLMDKAAAAVENELLDLERGWQSDLARDMFIHLPLDYVKQLLENDGLKVNSENAVFIAVASWIQHNCDSQTSTNYAASALLPAIRFPYLTSSFMSQIVSKFPWIQQNAHAQEMLMEALQYARGSQLLKRALENSSNHKRFQERPKSLMRKLPFKCTVSLMDLQAAANTADRMSLVQVVSSGDHYFKGCKLALQLEIFPGPAGHAQNGKVCGGLRWELGLHPHISDDFECADVAMRLAFEVTVVGQNEQDKLFYSDIGRSLTPHGQACGWGEFFGSANLQEWRKYANSDGKIVLDVVVHDCE